jgi:hypothetical protein
LCALHMQMVRGRKIVITEDPEMHALWINDRIFLKPLPPYLLSYAFWEYLVQPPPRQASDDAQKARTQITQAALGYVRTYTCLIRHESDLRIAVREGLVPDNIDLDRWMAFIRDFRYIEDDQVSGRYHYGELRLTRLNFWAKPLLRQWYFRKVYWQYAEYFARWFPPLLFVFALWSLALASMQTGLQARPHWNTLADVSAWFSIASLVGVLAVMVFFFTGFSILAGREIRYAVGKQIRKRKRRRRAKAAHVSKVVGQPEA